MTNRLTLPDETVWRVLSNTGYTEDIADETDLSYSMVVMIRKGYRYGRVHAAYVRLHGTPQYLTRPKAIRRKDLQAWLSRKRPDTSDEAAARDLKTSVRRVRLLRERLPRTPARQVQRDLTDPRDRGTGWYVPDAVCRAWGPATRGTLNGVKGRFSV